MNTLRTWIKKADVMTFIWWVLLVNLIFILPIYRVYVGTFYYNEEELSKSWWLYIMGVVIWDLFLLIVLTVSAAIALIFDKIGQWVYDAK